MEMNEEYMERILQAWGEAERAAYPVSGPRKPMLEAALPEGRLPNHHILEPGSLDLTISAEGDRSVSLHFEGHSPDWAGALLQCRWAWEEDNGEEGRILGFVRLDTEGFGGRFDGRVSSITPPVPWAPSWAQIDPRIAVPERFRVSLDQAQFKPTPTVLKDWVENNQSLIPPRFQEKWEAVLSNLD